MALGFGPEHGVPVPASSLRGSGEIINHLQRGETVRITMDQEFSLSELDDSLPDTGRIIYEPPPAQAVDAIDIVDFSDDSVLPAQTAVA